MIKTGDIIKHRLFMDVSVQVLFVSVNPENNDVLVKGVWINQGQTSTFSINEPAEFTITTGNKNDWLKCKKPDSNFIRAEEWEQIK